MGDRSRKGPLERHPVHPRALWLGDPIQGGAPFRVPWAFCCCLFISLSGEDGPILRALLQTPALLDQGEGSSRASGNGASPASTPGAPGKQGGDPQSCSLRQCSLTSASLIMPKLLFWPILDPGCSGARERQSVQPKSAVSGDISYVEKKPEGREHCLSGKNVECQSSGQATISVSFCVCM